MLIQYAYIKPRSQFGKQCFFDGSEVNVQDIPPDPQLMRDYVQRSHRDRGEQKSAQFALHEMQTVDKPRSDTGVFHFEGGWPREINPKDEESMYRFRRRVERGENWLPRMKKLITPMERCMKQNSAINIYEHYFDDIVPTALVLPRGVRTSNVYADPQPIVRPVSHLSWSSSEHNRLAGAYSFMEFERQPPSVDPCSYIWDIENPNKPVMQLRSSSPLMSIEFNPRDPSMLISGLMSGQVCNWDIRVGNRPVQTSHLQFSHRVSTPPCCQIAILVTFVSSSLFAGDSQRNPANQALWLTSKTNTEFFSACTSGTIRWWDIRKLKRPTGVLVMDLDDPERADVVKAVGVTSLQFEPAMDYKFMAGMQNGVVVNVNRRAPSLAEKLSNRFNCHHSPVIAIDRNPFTLKNFLTVGDCTAKIWADDTREDSLITIREQNADLSGGCWSRARHSVFFTINVTGLLEVYDILNGVDASVATFRVCDERLTTIAPHEAGHLLALGAHNGTIYLVECAEGHTVSSKADRANLYSYLESCSRFEKTVDTRLKEIRLMRADAYEDPAADGRPSPASKGRQKKKKDKMEDKGKAQLMKTNEHHLRVKPRSRKAGEHIASDVDLLEAQAEYFRAVEREFASYEPLDERISQDISRKRKKRVPPKMEKPIAEEEELKLVKKEKKRTIKAELPTWPLTGQVIVLEEKKKEEEEVTAMPVAKPTDKTKKRRRADILTKVCSVEICSPEICCADVEAPAKGFLAIDETSTSDVFPELSCSEQRKSELRAQLATKKRPSPQDVRPSRRPGELVDLAEKSPGRSATWRRRIPLQGESLAYVLASEAEGAKRKVRAWQRRVMSGKRDFWLSPRTSEIAYGDSEEEGEAGSAGDDDDDDGDDESFARKSDSRRCAGTRKSLRSEGDGETLSARGKHQAGRYEKHAREGDVRPT
ncbi:Dynein intermediate chain 2, axonemal [Harpegnathos saltator]|uniref:Dynein intermediate chain 2, axonemal n=1 Tax=Harpegnathos saltator TaxID=610380 RepID=E2BYR6_HARSA|nr:Dynein intermediate chain 2, axonemal [Harpegnathos saltator]